MAFRLKGRSASLSARLMVGSALLALLIAAVFGVLVYAVTREVADWWWLLPLAVSALLAVSVNDATRPRRR